MLSKKVKNYLKEEELELTLEYQKKFKDILLDYGFDLNSSFFELMSTYAGEFSGEEGTMLNVADDLSDKDNSYVLNLRKTTCLDEKYVQLLTSEYDDYLLYNKDDDSVILIEGMNDKRLKSGDFDQKWKSFDLFLVHFFDLD